MLTPFTEDGTAVDYEALRALSQWYLDSGAAGLFPVAQSSEMYTLSSEEVRGMQACGLHSHRFFCVHARA